MYEGISFSRQGMSSRPCQSLKGNPEDDLTVWLFLNVTWVSFWSFKMSKLKNIEIKLTVNLWERKKKKNRSRSKVKPLSLWQSLYAYEPGLGWEADILCYSGRGLSPRMDWKGNREREELGLHPCKRGLINANFLLATFIFLYYLSCNSLNLKEPWSWKANFPKDRICLNLDYRGWGRGWCLAHRRTWSRAGLLASMEVQPGVPVSFIDAPAIIRTDTTCLAARILCFTSASYLDLSLAHHCYWFRIPLQASRAGERGSDGRYCTLTSHQGTCMRERAHSPGWEQQPEFKSCRPRDPSAVWLTLSWTLLSGPQVYNL